MDPIYYVIIGAAVAAAAIGIVFFMLKKPSGKDSLDVLRQHNELLQSSLKKIKMLKVKLEGNAAVCAGLSDMYNRYSNVSTNGKPETMQIDRGIAANLSDLELCINKAEKSGDFGEIENLIKKINVAIAGR